MADNKILEELKKATEQVHVIASMEAKQRSEYLEELSRQFFELQKTVHTIISEEGIILNNFKWEWICSEKNRGSFDSFLESKAQLFASKYGFSKETVKSILKAKNAGEEKNEHYYVSYYRLVPKK